MFRSVRARLTLWYTAILALVLVIFSAVSYVLLSREIRDSTDTSLTNAAYELAANVGRDPVTGGVALDGRYSDEVMMFSPAGPILTSSRTRIAAVDRQHITELVRKGATGLHTIAGGRENDGIRLIALPVDTHGGRYIVVIARNLDEQADRLESAARAVFFGIPMALLVAALGGYVLARKSLAPVTSMSAKARQIGAETLGERIPAGADDELGFLSSTLNDLLERLERAFASQRRFMADASHELRTPISIIQGEADVALGRSDRPAGEYRESIAIMQDAARKLTRIVQNLFLLARTDAGAYPMTMSRFYLNELVADCVRAMRSVAASRSVEVRVEGASDIVIVGDEELVQRLMLNLIDNAVKFTPPGGRVSITVAVERDVGIVRVSDTGPGIAPEDRERIFERFFRADRARQSRGTGATGGAGLGLPIAKWIAESHHGRLVLERSDTTGSTFRVELPIDASS